MIPLSDAYRLADINAEICNAPANLDRGGLRMELTEVLSEYGLQSLGRFEVGGALTAVTRILHDYYLVAPSRFSMLIKCLMILEGTAKGLNVSFNLAVLLEPYQRQFVLKQFFPETWLRKAK